MSALTVTPCESMNEKELRAWAVWSLNQPLATFNEAEEVRASRFFADYHPRTVRLWLR